MALSAALDHDVVPVGVQGAATRTGCGRSSRSTTFSVRSICTGLLGEAVDGSTNVEIVMPAMPPVRLKSIRQSAKLVRTVRCRRGVRARPSPAPPAARRRGLGAGVAGREQAQDRVPPRAAASPAQRAGPRTTATRGSIR